jgi:predicted DNA-binding mobile mystery protein A
VKLKLSRRQLDEALKNINAFAPNVAPRGWLYAIRSALGMSRAVVAKKLGVTPAAVQQTEEREAALTISLASLQQAAQALDCHLVYAIVPNQSLMKTLHHAAEQAAKKIMKSTSQSMALEDQALRTASWQHAYDELVEELEKNPKLIWKTLA